MTQRGPAASETPMPRTLAVVVLYRTPFATSKTLAGLAQAFAEDPTLWQHLEILVWDNSPAPTADITLPFPYTYHHADSNVGVAGAYNGAAAMARDRGSDWLLLLDHDTTVTAAFLRGMACHARERTVDRQVAAVVPFLYAGRLPLSPRLWRFARHQPLPRSKAPYLEQRAIFAANSGVLLRVAALEQIGGYSPRFWLDYSDIYVFHRLHQAGLGVWMGCDLSLQHEIAMLDYDSRMTATRYATYLAAEGDFLDLYRGGMERATHLLRLAARVLRQRRYADPTFSNMSLHALVRRLTTRRKARLSSRIEPVETIESIESSESTEQER